MTRNNIKQNKNYVGAVRRRATLAGIFVSATVTMSAWAADEPSDTTDADKDKKKMEYVIVTAQKHEEREQEVPESITTLDPATLAENGQNSLIDYFASVPGLSMSNDAFWGGTHYITIRGVSAGSAQNPTVATVIDDVPVTSSLYRSWGNLSSPDLDPSDLARIEVLKGPQGTLYGTDSLSGLIKYVTVDPSTAKLSGRVEVSGSDIPEGAAGYTVRGAVNMPLSDTFAIRLSAFDRHDPGYINDITTGESNFNSVNVYGGRVAAMWRPAEDLSVKVSALVEEANGNPSLVNSNFLGQPALGGLDFASLPGSTQYSTQAQLYSATVDWKFNDLELVSVTGYVVNSFQNLDDNTAAIGQYAYACVQAPQQTTANCGGSSYYPLPNAPYLGTLFNIDVTTRKVSEELRLSSSVGKWLDWRLGGFYTYEGSPGADNGNDLIANMTTGQITGDLYKVTNPTLLFSEYAIFGDFTARVTDSFDVEAGVREALSRQAETDLTTGIGVEYFAGAPSPYFVPVVSEKGNAFTYQITPRYKISSNLMTYFRLATGYRIGGYNANASFAKAVGVSDIPATYKPDRTTNYEVGVKYDGLDHRLSIAAAAYHIAWKNFQLPVQTDFYGYTVTGGEAKVDGAELTLEAHPIAGLTVGLEGAYNNAVLTQNLPADAQQYGLKGDQLPYNIRKSLGLSLNQEFPITSQWGAFCGGSANYVGPRPTEFVYPPLSSQNFRGELSAYTQVNFHTGVDYNSLIVNLYVNNVADRRGVSGIIQGNALSNITGNVFTGGYDTIFIQPRTIGVNVSKSF